MIIIDTNILSEMMRDDPDVKIVAWIEQVGRLHTTTVRSPAGTF